MLYPITRTEIIVEQQHRALIIEDEYLLAMELQAILEGFGFEVCDMVATEDEAVESALRHRPDLITTDVKLLRGNGIKAVQRIAENHQACVIYVTGDWKDVEAQAEGAICVAKPFDANRIAQAIEEGRKLGHDRLPTLRRPPSSSSAYPR